MLIIDTFMTEFTCSLSRIYSHVSGSFCTTLGGVNFTSKFHVFHLFKNYTGSDFNRAIKCLNIRESDSFTSNSVFFTHLKIALVVILTMQSSA